MKNLEGVWLDLCRLLQGADELSEHVLLEKVSQLGLPHQLAGALRSAILGDTSEVFAQVFAANSTCNTPVVMLAPVNVLGRKHYAWMIGSAHPQLDELRQRFCRAAVGAGSDPLLLNQSEPPAVLFVEVHESAQFEGLVPAVAEEAMTEDFAIFRASGSSSQPTEDFDRQLLQNVTFITRNVQEAHRNGRMIFGDSLDPVQEYLVRDAELLGMLHVEAHNRGHFAGPWPFNSLKSGPMHDPVEEFRACLCAIRWGEHLELTSEQKDALTVSIFLTRFLYYGLYAYTRPVKTRQSIREVSVGLMFFETLVQAGAIQERHDGALRLEVSVVRPALTTALKLLHDQERAAKQIGPDALREVARTWYRIAYPEQLFSSTARRVYDAFPGRR